MPISQSAIFKPSCLNNLWDITFLVHTVAFPILPMPFGAKTSQVLTSPNFFNMSKIDYILIVDYNYIYTHKSKLKRVCQDFRSKEFHCGNWWQEAILTMDKSYNIHHNYLEFFYLIQHINCSHGIFRVFDFVLLIYFAERHSNPLFLIEIFIEWLLIVLITLFVCKWLADWLAQVVLFNLYWFRKSFNLFSLIERGKIVALP